MIGIASKLAAWRSERSGSAAIELAVIGSILAVAAMNAAEVGRYAVYSNAVGSATQAGAEAALVACDTAHTPATTNCPNLTTAVTTAIQGTALGTQVSLSGPITEGFYCLNGSNQLVYMADVSNQPADCSSVGQPTLRSVLYLQVSTTYAYQAMFPQLTMVRAFPQAITRTSWMRML
jgi:Flp pilus assembly protein TadG